MPLILWSTIDNMGRKSSLDSFIEYLETHNHKEDFYDVLKILYKASKDISIINNAKYQNDGFIIDCADCLYNWYVDNHKERVFIRGFDNMTDLLFKDVKSRMDSASYDLGAEEKLLTLYSLGNISDLALRIHKYGTFVEIINGHMVYDDLRYMIKALFKNLKSHPEIELYIKCAD